MLATSLLTTDIRCALRLWRRTPGFALTVVLVLSMGIGATTAVFSVVGCLVAPAAVTSGCGPARGDPCGASGAA